MSEANSRESWVDQYLPRTDGAAIDRTGNLISLETIRGLAFRQRNLLIGVILAVLVLSLVATLMTKPVYQASATVQVDSSQANIVEGQDLEPAMRGGEFSRYMSTQGAVIMSKRMAYQVVDTLKLADNDELLGDAATTRPANLSDEKWKARRREIAAAILKGGVSVVVPDDIRILTISFKSENPRLAASIANAYVDNFVLEDTRRGIEISTYAQNYLTTQIREIGNKLQNAEMAANAYAKANGIIATTAPAAGDTNGASPPATITVATLGTVSGTYTETRNRRIAAEQRWRNAQGLAASQLPEVQANNAIQALVAERSKVAAQISELRQRYGENYPQVSEARATLTSLDSQITRLSTDVKNSIRDQYQLALRQEEALSGELKKVSGDTLDEQDRRVRYNLLDREAAALRTQLAALLDRYNQVAAAANIQQGAITKVDDASVPGAPISPNLTKNLLAAMVVGIGLAVALAVLRDSLDDRLRSVDDVERKLGTPLLGFTPNVESMDVEAQVADPFSALMESYSSLRTSLDFAQSGDNRVLMVTSSQPSEGKTLTATVLARKYAELGHKTLLIDADLRKPTVSAMFGATKRPTQGFVEVLLGDIDLQSALIKGTIDNLSVLPVGSIPHNPVEILSSPRLAEFIQKCRGDYALIMIDSAPVMGLADAPLVSRLVDGVVFIVEANRSNFGQTKTALRRLRSVGANVLGVVLTKYRSAEAGLSYDYHYNYYSYGHGKKD
ncbi:polysaccharide biosynthesis tyrosine autokinase [Novosphingobium sp. AAP83]|uniref:GumC family protein n=1 Tax=Novosphingobium sp. AAP83 TaxID=1523425 RepID=UPI0018D1DE2C|nr:polysaccharide biosynthesis tyrosine autokinase [Novosphingobium sp. AAP83]